MYIKVRVYAGAKKEELNQVSDDHFELFVKEKAEMNMANRKVLELMARFYGARAGKVRIVSGHHSPGKILAVD